MSWLEHFHFLRPLWLLGLVPLGLIGWYLFRLDRPLGRWHRIIAPHLLDALIIKHGRSRIFNPKILSIVILTIALLALSGPTWRQQDSPFAQDLAPLVIALDVTESMLQRDVQPDRLDRAKQKIQDLLELRQGSLTGLIAYSGSAHTVIPLTNDENVITNFLHALTPEIMPKKGKQPESVLPLTDQMLSGIGVPGTILVIGDAPGPMSEQAFSRYFSDHPHQLIVYGMGLAPGDLEDSGVELQLALETDALKAMARSAGGVYQALTLDRDDVRRIDNKVSGYYVITEDDARPWLDSGYYLLYPLVLLSLLWFRKGWTLHWCQVAFVLLVATQPQSARANWFVDLWLTADQQGQFLYNQEKFPAAAEHYQDIYWRAVSSYKALDFETAIELFSRLDSYQGYFNLGNAYAHNREYLLAVKAYDQALESRPGDESATWNRELIQKIIDEINAVSATQQAEVGEASKELTDEDPQTAEGVEREDMIVAEPERLSAEQLLSDPGLQDTWMKQVQSDPARFLGVKFSMQLQARSNDQGAEPDTQEQP